MTIENVRKMNKIGIIGWSIMAPIILFTPIYLYLCVDRIEGRPVNYFSLIVIGIIACALAAGLIISPLWTGRALSPSSSHALKRRMIWVNWAWIGLWCFFAYHAISLDHWTDALWTFLFFVIPQWINISALRTSMALEVPDSRPSD